jgi:organic radical activating enzyme
MVDMGNPAAPKNILAAPLTARENQAHLAIETNRSLPTDTVTFLFTYPGFPKKEGAALFRQPQALVSSHAM